MNKNNKQRSNNGSEPKKQAKKYQRIKIAADVHAAQYVVSRQIENANPQPPQRMTPTEYLRFVSKQLKEAEEVWTCYEAGPTGFWLHRQLEAMGVKNLVVRPKRLEEYGRKVENDKTDVLGLVNNLDRYVAGNQKALVPIWVPTEEQEYKRAESRQRNQLRKLVGQVGAMGRSQMLLHGYRIKGAWWKVRAWEALQEKLPSELCGLLEPLRAVIEPMEQQLGERTKQLEEAASQARPKGMGALTLEQMDREAVDWNRFKNRKQVGSYAGVVGGVSASGNSHQDLSITKHGNTQLRYLLIELAWRMVRYQPQSRLIQRWKDILLNPRAHRRLRKKAIVAVARALAVDIWRWRTGRVSAAELGWKMVSES